MDRAPDAWRVPGEGAPLGVVIAALLLGLSLGGAALAQHRAPEPPVLAAPLPPEPVEQPRPSTLTNAAPVPARDQPLPSAAPVAAPVEPPSDCREPLVVSFERASHELSINGRREARRFARWAAARDGRVLVRGHADRAGASSHNLVLSERRARTVEAVLRAQGVAEERVLLQAFGEHQPAGRSDAGNRRVEVVLEGVPPCGGAT